MSSSCSGNIVILFLRFGGMGTEDELCTGGGGVEECVCLRGE